MISDNNHITYTAEDIQRYWKGQLSAQEMHAMEKAALDDPFLADAMEGMGVAMQQHDQKTLNHTLAGMHQQIEDRAAGTQRRALVITFHWWKVAAAASVLIIAGYWFFSSGVLDRNELATTKNKNAEAFSVPTDSDSKAAPQGAAAAAEAAPVSDSTETIASKEINKAEERGFVEFKTPSAKEKELDNLILTNSQEKPEKPKDTIFFVSTDADKKQAAARASGLTPAINFDTVQLKAEVVRPPVTAIDLAKADENKDKDAEPKLQNIIKGVVTDDRNNPLANVYIRPDNNQTAYLTDLTGQFKIPANDSVMNVSVSLPGYTTQQFQLRNNFSGAGNLAENKIKLQTNENSLSEVVVVGYGKKARAATGPKQDTYKITDQDAQPVYGWLSYQQYLDDNKKVPDSNSNLTGEVAISFNIDKKGVRSDYRVERSLSPGHDAEALRLVREGPEWKLTKGRKARVTVLVRF